MTVWMPVPRPVMLGVRWTVVGAMLTLGVVPRMSGMPGAMAPVRVLVGITAVAGGAVLVMGGPVVALMEPVPQVESQADRTIMEVDVTAELRVGLRSCAQAQAQGGHDDQ